MTFSAQRYSMLVIDDDEGILKVFRRIFEKKGYQVATAQTGKEAKEKLLGRDYDVALVDLTLSDMNGADLLPGMKKKFPRMIRIVITGLSSEEKDQILEMGADAFLEKPVHPQLLIDLLEEKLNEKRLDFKKELKN